MILDHIGFGVNDVEKTKDFYGKALAPLGIAVVMEAEGWIGMGRDGRPQFWFGGADQGAGPIHLAFTARNREEVRAFYAAALEAGGTDNGAPGLRPQYHPDYYGAFVLDPDGHNIEAVCHAAER
jgi:catechol 2,3-dioxygenase-like lactoylglutathione lyase family enzyme